MRREEKKKDKEGGVDLRSFRFVPEATEAVLHGVRIMKYALSARQIVNTLFYSTKPYPTLTVLLT